MLRERVREAAAPALVFLIAAGTIGGAWYSQLVLGFQPCHLCLIERIPYYVALPVTAAAIIAALTGVPSRWVRLIMAIAGVTFGVSFFLGLNHAGIEWGWWPGPTDCVPTSTGVKTIKELQEQLRGIQIVPCDRATWRFLGLSFAGWNAVMSVVLTGLSAYAAAGGLSTVPITIVRKTPKAVPAK